MPIVRRLGIHTARPDVPLGSREEEVWLVSAGDAVVIVKTTGKRPVPKPAKANGHSRFWPPTESDEPNDQAR